MRASRKSGPGVVLVLCVALSSAASGRPQDKAGSADTTIASASVKPAVAAILYGRSSSPALSAEP
jgi:hypothetical protein